jgi:hypothetical protein
MSLLNSVLEMVSSVVVSAWTLVMSLLVFVFDVLAFVHIQMPRTEGLVIGVLLAWLMMRRDKHPAIRVISAPLKLVVDILDLAWDQFVEVIDDTWSSVAGWVSGALGWCKDRVVSIFFKVMNTLSAIKDKVSK